MDAQEKNNEHHRYKVIDTGTLGGPTSSLGFEGERDINNQGTLVSLAETSIPDPFSPNCFLGDCFLGHTVEWRNGLLMDLDALPGGNSGPIWISDSGLISGLSQNGRLDSLTGMPEFRAILWEGGKIIDLGTFGGNNSCAGAVNNHGQVVGAATTAILDPFSLCFGSQQARAFLWENGTKKDIGTLGGPDAIAEFINERGQVAGHSFTNSTPNPVIDACGGFTTEVPTDHPFIWDGGQMTDLGTLGGTCGFPNHMNGRGQVVGLSDLAGDSTEHPFLWTKGEGMKDLGTLGGDFGSANWLNDAGEVVGFAATQDDQAFFAFLWIDGKMTNLGIVAGDPCSVAYAINSQGQIVGSSGDCSGNGLHAFLWEDGSITDLNAFVSTASGVQLTDALSINESGEIAAQGVLANGDVHAFVLIPCEMDNSDSEGCRDADVATQSGDENHVALSAQAPATAAQPNLSPSEMKDRIRALLTNRNRRFRSFPPK
jgi:probable HAF family extracellular repeat protein